MPPSMPKYMERWTARCKDGPLRKSWREAGGKAFTLLKIRSEHHLNWEGQKNDERNNAHRRIGNVDRRRIHRLRKKRPDNKM